MRHFIMFLPAVAIVLQGAAFGQDRTAASKTSGVGTRESVWEAVVSAPESPRSAGKIEMARGAVIGIEKALARFTIVLPDNRPLAIQTEMKTSLRAAGNEVEIWDLRLGDRVTVAYRVEGGRNIARTITVER